MRLKRQEIERQKTTRKNSKSALLKDQLLRGPVMTEKQLAKFKKERKQFSEWLK